MPRLKQDLISYAIAILAAFAALLLRKGLGPFLGDENPYHTAWMAVAFCSWFCGIGPSVMAVILSLLGICYWLIPPYYSFAGKSQAQVFGMIFFLVFSAIIIALGESVRRTIAKRKEAEDQLRELHVVLEERIREGTAALQVNAATLQEKTAELKEKAAFLDLANDAIFVKTAKGVISYWNRGAERLYGWTMEEARGRSPAELLRSDYPVPLVEIEGQDNWEGEIGHTTRDGRRLVVASRWTTLRDQSRNPVGWLEINTDITSRKQAEAAARRLSGRILSLQDEERRRLARGLHDSLGQYLAALKMNVDRLTAAVSEQVTIASECSEVAEKCLAETRTVSHLLHPPLLDEAGFVSAARWYVDGFAQRSGISVNLDIPSEIDRMHRDVETALFRTVQEALTNVHRHSGASCVDIKVSLFDKRVRMEISDNGQGIPDAKLMCLLNGEAEAGVGIAGMRERMRELGGTLEVHANGTGTTIVTTTPTLNRVPTEANQDGTSRRSVTAA